jgi:hypothetical protein
MVDAFAMSAVWLVDGFDEWVLGRILIGDLTGFVFGAIVDDDDFNVFSEWDEGVDGVVQVFLAVIGRDAHCY